MPILTVAAFAMAVLGGQEAPVENPAAPAARARPANPSTPVSDIATRQAPPPSTPTRNVCSLERATGSNMSRRVCRDVPINSSQRDQSTNDTIRQMQGSRYGERPNGM